jgi:threonyl-tRNA synthetase
MRGGGAKEQGTGEVSVRSAYEGDEGSKPLSDFIAAISEEIRTKAIRPIKAEEE